MGRENSEEAAAFLWASDTVFLQLSLPVNLWLCILYGTISDILGKGRQMRLLHQSCKGGGVGARGVAGYKEERREGRMSLEKNPPRGRNCVSAMPGMKETQEREREAS